MIPSNQSTIYLSWDGEDQKLELGTKNNDLIVGDWIYHDAKSMGDGFSAFALNLTDLSYDSKHLNLKTSGWPYVGSAYVLPMVG